MLAQIARAGHALAADTAGPLVEDPLAVPCRPGATS
jgi:hypothetical protein